MNNGIDPTVAWQWIQIAYAICVPSILGISMLALWLDTKTFEDSHHV